MSKCYHCGAILSDDWIKHEGASLMGKEGGKNKSRHSAREAALARWEPKKKKKK